MIPETDPRGFDASNMGRLGNTCAGTSAIIAQAVATRFAPGIAKYALPAGTHRGKALNPVVLERTTDVGSYFLGSNRAVAVTRWFTSF